MSFFSGKAVSLWGIDMCVPERILTNQELERMVDTSNEWILERTGIRERRIAAPGEQTSDLAAAAGRGALDRAGIAAGDLDMIIVATNSPDTLFPCTAAKVQGILGATKAGAFDVQSGCTGCVYALTVAVSGIASGIWRHVLVIGAEVLSRLINWKDRNTCVLFGDGAGACVLGPRREADGMFISAALRADGTKHDLISIPAGCSERPTSEETLEEGAHFVHMKGNDVFKFVNKELPPFLQAFCEDSSVKPECVDWWIFHQANWRIMEGVLRRFGIAPERAIVNLDRYGNTSSASVFLVLSEAFDDGRIRRGQKIVINSFGAGMTYGAILLEV